MLDPITMSPRQAAKHNLDAYIEFVGELVAVLDDIRRSKTMQPPLIQGTTLEQLITGTKGVIPSSFIKRELSQEDTETFLRLLGEMNE